MRVKLNNVPLTAAADASLSVGFEPDLALDTAKPITSNAGEAFVSQTDTGEHFLEVRLQPPPAPATPPFMTVYSLKLFLPGYDNGLPQDLRIQYEYPPGIWNDVRTATPYWWFSPFNNMVHGRLANLRVATRLRDPVEEIDPVLFALEELVAWLRPAQRLCRTQDAYDGRAVCFYVTRQSHVTSLRGWFLGDGVVAKGRVGVSEPALSAAEGMTGLLHNNFRERF